MKKPGKLTTLLLVSVIALLFLLVRENEQKVAARSQMANLQFKTTSVLNEKGEAIADLSTQVGEMQAQLQQTVDECRAALEERDTQITNMNLEAQQKAADHEAAVQALEAETKENADKYDAALKKKNTELSEIGEELRKTTERLAAALKEKEQAEAENYDFKTTASSLGRKIAKLSADNKRLEGLAKACEGASALADGPKNTA